jgi:hypothetical protein
MPHCEVGNFQPVTALGALGQLYKCTLKITKDLFRRILGLICPRHGIIAELDQPAQQPVLPHDPRVMSDVDGARKTVCQADEICGPASRLEFA